MAEPFSPFTKVIIRPCADCKRDCAILVGSRVPQGEIVSARCPDCHQKFKEKYPDHPNMEEARMLSQLLENAELKSGDGK